MDAVTVIGAGGIGCAIGYALRAGGLDVEFVETAIQKIEFGNRRGVQVDHRPAVAARFVHFDEWRPNAARLHLLCTKCYDNESVLLRLPEETPLLPIQNGFDANLENRGHGAEGIASFVSECQPNQPITRITRRGHLHVGSRDSSTPPWLPRLSAALRQAKLFPVLEVEDIGPLKHTKLMYNAAISPLAAASGIDNGQLLQLPAARRLFFAFLKENYSILKSANKSLGQVGPFHPDTVMRILGKPWLSSLLAKAFTPGLRGTYCSMALDIEKGRTEVENYNGQLISWSGATPCPLNRRAVEIVNQLTSDGQKPNVTVLNRFEPAAAPISPTNDWNLVS